MSEYQTQEAFGIACAERGPEGEGAGATEAKRRRQSPDEPTLGKPASDHSWMSNACVMSES